MVNKVTPEFELALIEAALENKDTQMLADIAADKTATLASRNAFIRHIYHILEQRRQMEPDNALRMDLEMLLHEIRDELGVK